MSPNLELQGAIVARLKTTGAVTSLVGTRVYDHVPRGENGAIAAAAYPFVAIGPSDDVQNDAECIEAVDVTISVEVWSQKPGMAEAKKVAEAVRAALHGYAPTPVTNAIIELRHDNTRHENPGDGTTQSIVEFTATIEIH